MQSSIHPTAQIHTTAVIGEAVTIGAATRVGPYSVVGDGVAIGAGNDIRSHVVIEGNTTIGDENVIYQFASIGAAPQDLKYKGEPSRLDIGNANVIREYVTLQPGTQDGGMLTKVGDFNLLMACSHVAHDVIMGSRNILANSCALAGHITVHDGVIAGGLSGVHQFVRLGALCYLGAGSMVSQDVPPFCIAQGDRAGLVGINVVGLRRAGKSNEVIQAIKELYRKVFYVHSEKTLKERVQNLLGSVSLDEEQLFLKFILDSPRGVCAIRK